MTKMQKRILSYTLAMIYLLGIIFFPLAFIGGTLILVFLFMIVVGIEDYLEDDDNGY